MQTCASCFSLGQVPDKVDDFHFAHSVSIIKASVNGITNAVKNEAFHSKIIIRLRTLLRIGTP